MCVRNSVNRWRSAVGESFDRTIFSDSGCRHETMSDDGVQEELIQAFRLLESLILAQDERWRRA